CDIILLIKRDRAYRGYRNSVNLSRDDITSVVIPDGVTSIGYGAFMRCENLESVTIPDSVSSIAIQVFGNCKKLTSIKLPDGLERIESYTFSYCTGLKEVVFPNTLTYIDYCAFSNCTTLEYVVIPSSVATLNYSAFEQCSNLKAAVILNKNMVFNNSSTIFMASDSLNGFKLYGYDPSTAKDVADSRSYDFVAITDDDIGNPADYEYKANGNGTAELTAYTGSDTVVNVPMVIDNYLITSVGKTSFVDLTNITEVTIPTTVTSIGESAFNSCSALESVVVPETVTSIGTDAFNACSADFELKGYAPSCAEEYANTYSVTFTSLNDSNPSHYRYSVDDEDNAIIVGYTGSGKYLDIPSVLGGHTVTGIDNNAFRGLTMKRVRLPETVTFIGNGAFYECFNLEYINIPEGVISIGDSAFSDCRKLSDLVLPDTLTSIGHWAFYNCWGITSVEIPYNVTTLGQNAFYYCRGLESVDIGIKITTIPLSAFEGCHLKNVVIPPRVTRISERAFNCYTLETITIPRSVEAIYGTLVYGGSEKIKGYSGSYAQTYAEDNNIDFIPISEGSGTFEFADAGKGNVALIGYNGSGGNVTIPSSHNYHPVTAILGAFGNCSSVTKVTIPSSVKIIDKSAFSNCDNLTEVVIPSSVETIADWSFNSCGKLKSITIPDKVKRIGDHAFDYCDALESLTIGSGVESIGDYAFYMNQELTNLEIPKNVKSIGNNVFYDCAKLEHVKITNRTTTFGSNVFTACSKLEVNGYDGSSAETYAQENNVAFSPLLKINTGSGYEYLPLSNTQTRDNSDNSFSFDQNIYGNIELLGAQQKTDKGSNDIRFIAVVNEGIVNSATEIGSDIEDYGFVIARSEYSSTAAAGEDYISGVVLNGENTSHRSGKFTNNTYSGRYGKLTSNTKYKYVTLAVKDIAAGESFVVRFYIRTRSGKVYYADYNSSYTGCVASYNTIFSQPNPNGENSTLHNDVWKDSPFFVV
ncbi:MAG: leucine-rich repeat domain-containing protein, partial [Ruminococcus sp.]|nr:leucine-rich repeat domain-containing protein [Ruminococcus sp.]